MMCEDYNVRPPPSLIPEMLSTVPERAGATLDSAEALLQWMLFETNKHPPPPPDVCPGTALSLNSVVALSKVLFLFILRNFFWFVVVKYREEHVSLLPCES